MRKKIGNQRDDEGIVYEGAKEKVVLVRDDFGDEREYLYWKAVLSHEKQDDSRSGRIALWDNLDNMPQDESEVTAQIDVDEVMLIARRYTTNKQYRRLWMYAVDGMHLNEIAMIEGVSIPAAWKSIAGAKKKVLKVWMRWHRIGK